jgi:hypothetical protein
VTRALLLLAALTLAACHPSTHERLGASAQCNRSSACGVGSYCLGSSCAPVGGTLVRTIAVTSSGGQRYCEKIRETAPTSCQVACPPVDAGAPVRPDAAGCSFDCNLSCAPGCLPVTNDAGAVFQEAGICFDRCLAACQGACASYDAGAAVRHDSGACYEPSPCNAVLVSDPGPANGTTRVYSLGDASLPACTQVAWSTSSPPLTNGTTAYCLSYALDAGVSCTR